MGGDGSLDLAQAAGISPAHRRFVSVYWETDEEEKNLRQFFGEDQILVNESLVQLGFERAVPSFPSWEVSRGRRSAKACRFPSRSRVFSFGTHPDFRNEFCIY
jgi:hypothetical protein